MQRKSPPTDLGAPMKLVKLPQVSIQSSSLTFLGRPSNDLRDANSDKIIMSQT